MTESTPLKMYHFYGGLGENAVFARNEATLSK